MLLKFLSKFFHRRAAIAFFISSICLLYLINAPDSQNKITNKKQVVLKPSSIESTSEIKTEVISNNAVQGIQLDFDNDTEEKPKVSNPIVNNKNVIPPSAKTGNSKSIKMYGSLDNVLNASKSTKISSTSAKKVKLIQSSLAKDPSKAKEENKKEEISKEENLALDVTKDETTKSAQSSVLSFDLQQSNTKFVNVTDKTLEVLKSIKENNQKSLNRVPVQEHVNSDILLREQANATQKEVQIDNELNQKLAMTWVPKYLKEKITTAPNTDKNSGDQATAANQIELIDLIENNVAVIKNTSNNMIEYLRSGDNYNGLKLVQINNQTIILSNIADGKRYIKILAK